MDPKPASPPPTNDATAKPAAAPAMDVVAAPPPQTDRPAPTAGPIDPSSDKPHAPPPADSPPDGKAPVKLSKLELPPKPAKPVTAKQPRSGVGPVVFSTIVIVLGLAALAVYAYLKSK